MLRDPVGHYHILSHIGGGGMGVVYKALDTRLNRPVAIKQLRQELIRDPNSLSRLHQEAQLAASIDHPYICKVYELLETEGETLIIMEYVEGETLASILQRRVLTVPEMLRYGAEMAEALGEAHKKGLIHRDIKPSNIILTPQQHIKITDFGVARTHAVESPDQAETRETLTPQGGLVGTLYYMSPEQAAGKRLDQRSDIFALGVLMFECLTARLPFEGKAGLYLRSVLTDTPRPLRSLLPEAPEPLERTIARCLEKEPSSRFESAAALLAQLTEISESIRSRPPGAVPSGEPQTPTEERRRLWPALNRRIATLLAATLLLLLFLLPPLRRPLENWLGFGIPAEKHLAVLPFTLIGTNPDDQAFCNGLAETLASALTQLEQFQGSLWVVPMSEVRTENIASASQARKAFGVNLTVEGSMQRAGDQVVLTLNLVDTASRRQLDSKTINGRMLDLSLFQESIVQAVAEMLQIELRPPGLSVLAAGGTTVPGALELYLQGLDYLRRYDRPENVQASIDLFQRALREDPDYALAYAALGEAYLRKFEAGKEAGWIDQAVAHCRRALQLDSRLPAVYVTLGLIATATGGYEEAARQFLKALELDSRNADAHRGLASTYEALAQLQQGKTYEALAQLEQAESTYQKAIALRPEYWVGYNLLGGFYYRHGRYSEAVTQWRQVASLIPDSTRGYNNVGAAYMMLEKWREAREMFERSLEVNPNAAAYSNLGTLYFGEERYAEAASMYEKALALDDRRYVLWGNLASAYRETDRTASARDLFKRAIEMAREELRVNPRSARVLSSLAHYHAAIQERSSALEFLQQALSLAPENVDTMWAAAETYEQLGERDKALEFLSKALDRGYSLERIRRSATFRRLRSDPHFEKLLEAHRGHQQNP